MGKYLTLEKEKGKFVGSFMRKEVTRQKKRSRIPGNHTAREKDGATYSGGSDHTEYVNVDGRWNMYSTEHL